MMSLASRTRVLCWLSYTVLFLQQALAAWLGQAPWIIWLAVLLPLLIFLPGMLQDNLRTFIWLCFVCLLYFMRLVVDLFENPADPLAISGMIAVVLLFCSGMMYVRWRARELRQAAMVASGHGD
ncbi:DUF2069 domain-containing protein [Seongchinamella sediminis]|uniref:DUF2069 domain-containing protein n=1 Tax=Seongchinamella sediminis TaxID=2283635 RepID=A0A3L7DZ88_9GAMM|nr:DUF2069 domain-containing protein [Seongchinamella sediminis]RLQ21975.1 DUF2069 domain-containing protein [Seongchinamella sediminis]